MKLHKIMLATGVLLLTTGCEDEYIPVEVKPPVPNKLKEKRKRLTFTLQTIKNMRTLKIM